MGFAWLVWLLVPLVVFYAALPASAFVLPSNTNVGPGSEWIYSSNLGSAKSTILGREKVGDDWHYRWELTVAGLRYREELRLTGNKLSVINRTFRAFSVFSDAFTFPEDELTMELPLKVGAKWEWSGPVRHRQEAGVSQVSGQVLSFVPVEVPAGTFKAYEIVLDRLDNMGTKQHIRLWLEPEIGVVKAEATLRWRGLVGRMQDLVGFDDFCVELKSYHLVQPEGDPK